TFEICYKEHTQAARASFFPGFKKIGDNTVLMETDDFYEVMRAVVWVL
ncbi:MAG: M55 family metallopeptidase, partial [Eubacterium sp.]|nr:M55 family metallopeptidase [Eubacterium sp.]